MAIQVRIFLKFSHFLLIYFSIENWTWLGGSNVTDVIDPLTPAEGLFQLENFNLKIFNFLFRSEMLYYAKC